MINWPSVVGRQLEATMLWVDSETVAICKDEWSILLGEDGKPYQDEFKSNIKSVNPTFL